ncbi:MAG: GNAT family N-acetyltransferase [Anaerolineales bacterium]|jgi:GNAT superfamily N-acetyltransferase|nr:GNAT family N-acetyltransferase [Anaerolineales bacterium]
MPQIIETHRDSFIISTDPARLNMDTICDMLSRAYWANTRPRERTEMAFEHSLAFGIYTEQKQIGVARIVTDYSVFAYLCDFFIHEEYRAHGLGKWALETILNHPDLKHIRRWMLVTDDAHGLYRQFDFELISEPEKWMQRIRPFHGEA